MIYVLARETLIRCVCLITYPILMQVLLIMAASQHHLVPTKMLRWTSQSGCASRRILIPLMWTTKLETSDKHEIESKVGWAYPQFVTKKVQAGHLHPFGVAIPKSFTLSWDQKNKIIIIKLESATYMGVHFLLFSFLENEVKFPK